MLCSGKILILFFTFVADKNKLCIEKKLEEHAQQSILRALTASALLDPKATELFVSGDNSWSHCRQAGESSFEFIAPSVFGEYKLKPVLACSLCMKELKGIGDINSSSEKVARVSCWNVRHGSACQFTALIPGSDGV